MSFRTVSARFYGVPNGTSHRAALNIFARNGARPIRLISLPEGQLELSSEVPSDEVNTVKKHLAAAGFSVAS